MKFWAKPKVALLCSKHFLPVQFKIGKNFLNPFYQDTKASCNIYLDKKSGIYRIKDFGDNRFNGDCFSFVAALNNLNIADRDDFKKVINIIKQEVLLNSTSEPMPNRIPIIKETPENTSNSIEQITFKDLSQAELSFWQKYNITQSILETFNVHSIQSFTATNKNSKQYTIQSTEAEPIFGYKHKHFIKNLSPEFRTTFPLSGRKI
jgi:hypothetical protein